MATRIPREPRNVFVPVTLPGGGVWRLRPATSIDIEVATAKATAQLAGLVTGSEAQAALAQMFGNQLSLGDELDADRITGVTRFLGDVHLALLCSDGWSGVEYDNGELVLLHEGSAAFVLADSTAMQSVRRVLYLSLLAEQAEKKGSAASPDGGAGADGKPAPTAAPAEKPARSDDPAAESSVQK